MAKEITVFYNYNESADTLEFMVQISLGWFQCIENWTESVTWIFVCFLPPTNWTLNSWWKLKKKENEKECVKAVLYIVILEYSLYSKLSCCIRFTVIQRVLRARAKTIALEQKKYGKQKASIFSFTWMEQRGLRSIVVKPRSRRPI